MPTVCLTKMIETKTTRFHLQRTVVLENTPQIGWFVHGFTSCPAVRLDVAKMGVQVTRDGDEIVHCIMTEVTVDRPDALYRPYLREGYGDEWKITEVPLS